LNTVRLIIGRLLQGMIVILGTTVAAFLLVRVIPSDPARLMAPQANEKQLQALRAELGFDKPLVEQLAIFLGDAARGDFGNSVYLHDPVTSLIIEKFPLTLVLALCALCFALAVSLPLGVIAALQRDTIWDRLSLLVSISILSMPNFWLGLELLFLVAVRWRLLPAQGFSSWRNFILPSFTLSLTLMPIYIRMTRASMIDVLNQDFIKALIARGVPMRRIIFAP
jgi:ABC-type dipeptide/oligopeptide/nickel transport system permease component